MEEDPFAVLEAMTIVAFATGCDARLRLRARRVPARDRAARGRDRGRAHRRIPGRARRRNGLRLRHRGPPRRRGLHLRRGDRPLQLDRGLPRRAAQQAAVPGREGSLRQAHRHQQRRDAGLRAAHRPRRRRRVRGESGRGQSTGPKLFCLSGHVARPGVYEVAVRRDPPRSSSRGRRRAGRPGASRAVLLGGAAGSFVGPDALDDAADLRGHARDRRHASARASSWSSTSAADLRGRRPPHRRVLPRRVVRPVRALPRRDRQRQEELVARWPRERPLGSIAQELALLDEIGAGP